MILLNQISILALGRPSARVRTRAPRRRRSGEEGYTLLFAVFLAASMLIMLTVVSLKITTQGQREAEEEMVWRGHQYERGIRRYVQKFGRYPTKIDDLVKATSGVRYMREAYKDPMNKDDGSWRFIYVTPAGALIGSVRYTSLVQMALMDKMASMGGSMNAMGGGIPGLGGSIPGSSSPFGNSGGFGNSSGFGSPGGFGSSSNGFGNQGTSAFGQQGNQGQNTRQQNQNQNQNQNQSGNQDDSGDTNATGNSGGNPQGNSPGGQTSPGGQNGLGGGNSSTFGIGGGNNGQQSGSAFGFSSDQGSGSSPLGQMSVLGGSITGVGSKVEKPSLMVYKRAKKYKEWEFIYNPIELQQQAAAGMSGGSVGIGQPANGQGGIGGSSFGTPGGRSNPFSPQPPPQQPPPNPQQPNP
jgi:hypothetical protein